MNIHEYQAKELLRKYQVPVPDGGVAHSVEEAMGVVDSLDFPVVVKAQIHAGGRGKGGGIKVTHNRGEAEQAAGQILGMKLVTPQTDSMGRLVGKILVEQGINIDQEFYLGILPDRATASIAIMASREGGMNIEEVAESTPERIITCRVDPLLGVQPFHLRELAFGLQLPKQYLKDFNAIVMNLYALFLDHDCSLVEINPLVATAGGELICADAKLNFDANGLYRQQTVASFRDTAEEEPLELEAAEHGLNYIHLGGNVGNIVNGAGLAMATMDIIQAAGARPANFLDVGGGATSEQVEHALRIILQDKAVKGVFINIFGGILRCDVFAKGVVQAAAKVDFNLPMVVRMEGTNVEEGRRILHESGLLLQTAEDLQDAAAKVAAMVNEKGEE